MFLKLSCWQMWFILWYIMLNMWILTMVFTAGCVQWLHVLCLGNGGYVNVMLIQNTRSSANATLRASGMPSVQNVIFKATKQVKSLKWTRVGWCLFFYFYFLQHFNLNINTVHTRTYHMGLFSRSKQLGWTHLCTTTGSNISTGRAQHMESFPGNELQLHHSFPHLALHTGRRVI